MLADASAVLDAAQSHELVDTERLFLYGWSEGTPIATSLAVSREAELAGLVVQGPVTLPAKETFQFQFADVGLPYLRSLAPDGLVDIATLGLVMQGDGGVVAKSVMLYIADPASFGSGQIKINGFFDTNKDGKIDIDAELLPNFSAYLDELFKPGGPFGNQSSDQSLPTVTEAAPNLKIPLFIMQGEYDANVPVFGAQLLNVALVANPDHLLKVFPGHGHSLGETPSLIQDNLQPIAQQPMADLAAWLLKYAGQ